jgi:hypothetical protein
MTEYSILYSISRVTSANYLPIKEKLTHMKTLLLAFSIFTLSCMANANVLDIGSNLDIDSNTRSKTLNKNLLTDSGTSSTIIFPFSSNGYENSIISIEANNVPKDVGLIIRSVSSDETHFKFNIADGISQLPSITGKDFTVTVDIPKGMTIPATTKLFIKDIQYFNHTKISDINVRGPGTDDRRPLVCYKDSDPFIYLHSLSSVGLFGGQVQSGRGGRGSASAIGNDGLYMTNHHVIGSVGDITLEGYYNNHHKFCEGSNEVYPAVKIPMIANVLTGRDASSGQDYTVFKANPFDYENAEVKRIFGHLKLAKQNPKIGTEIFVPQSYHKSIVGSVVDDGSNCTVEEEHDISLRYKCDTTGGSSGSPVISKETGEFVAVHYGTYGSINTGVSIKAIASDYPQLIDRPGNEGALPTGAEVDFQYVSVSPYENEGDIKTYPDPVYLVNSKLRMEHFADYSLLYPNFLNEKTGIVVEDAESVKSIKLWFEGTDGNRYGIDKVVPVNGNVTLKYSYDDNDEEFYTRSWFTFDVYSQLGELLEHLIVKSSTQWVDVNTPPFDVDGKDTKVFNFDYDSSKGRQQLYIPGNSRSQGMTMFHPDQGPIALTWADTGTNRVPVMVEEVSTGQKSKVYLTGFREACALTYRLNTRAQCRPIPHMNFVFEPESVKHLKTGIYKGIIAGKVWGLTASDSPFNALINVTFNVEEKADYEVVTIYSQPNQQNELFKVSQSIPDVTGNKHIQSFDIPSGFAVRFYQGANYSGGYYSRSGKGNLDVGEIASIKFTSRPDMAGVEAWLPVKTLHPVGDELMLNAKMDELTTDNLSLTYKWRLPKGYTITNGSNTSSITVSTPDRIVNDESAELIITDGVSETKVITLISSHYLDNTAPIFAGVVNITINKGEQFDPMSGVTAFDDVDGDLTSSITIIGQVNTSIVGDYHLIYHVQDNQGNMTELTRVITVKDSSCGNTDPDSSKYPAWKQTTVYVEGDIVSHENLVWKAKYWTKGNTPLQTDEQWELLSNVQTSWNKNVIYDGGDLALHMGRQWQAKWWTKGDEPSVSDVWLDKGAASCN